MTHLDFTCLSPVGIWVCRRHLRRLNYHRCLTTQFIKEMHLHCTGEIEVKGVLDRALGHQQSYPLALVLWLEYSGGKTSQPPSHRGCPWSPNSAAGKTGTEGALVPWAADLAHFLYPGRFLETGGDESESSQCDSWLKLALWKRIGKKKILMEERMEVMESQLP